VNIGYYDVATATNTSKGVVRGNDVDLGVIVDAEGKMSVKNLQPKLDGLMVATETNAANIANAVKITSDQNIDGIKTFSQSPVVPMPTQPAEVANKDYADMIVGAFAVPDYSRIESVNRISTNNGTWTADRTGFVICGIYFTAATTRGGGLYFYINGNLIFADTIYNTTGHNIRRLIPVKKGNVVRFEFLNSSGSFNITCYFIPPYVVTQEQLQQEAQ